MVKLALAFMALGCLSQPAQAGNGSVYQSHGFTLAAPPAEGTRLAADDESILKEYQATRTEDECAKADHESHLNLNSLFGPQTGVLTASEVSSMNSIARRVILRGGWVTTFFKSHFKRPRPYHEDLGINPCIRKPFDLFGKRSYPSSYAVIATMLEEVLVRKFPEKRELIVQQAKQIGINRVLGGVHHPSDITAGEELGRQIAEQYLANHPDL
jgi:acid phosphatase (class A)